MPDRHQELERLLRDGQGELRSATLLGRPYCRLCGKKQSRFYLVVQTGAATEAVCLPCGNSRRQEGRWIDPDAAGERTTNIQIPFEYLPPAARWDRHW